MTKREIQLARNENEQTFRKLSPEAQAAVRKALAEGVAKWIGGNGDAWPWPCTTTGDGQVYTIDPDVKPEDETPEGYWDSPVDTNTHFFRARTPEKDIWMISVLCKDFVAIGYELNGKITLRTSVDAAFGVPKFVRFRK